MLSLALTNSAGNYQMPYTEKYTGGECITTGRNITDGIDYGGEQTTCTPLVKTEYFSDGVNISGTFYTNNIIYPDNSSIRMKSTIQFHIEKPSSVDFRSCSLDLKFLKANSVTTTRLNPSDLRQNNIDINLSYDSSVWGSNSFNLTITCGNNVYIFDPDQTACGSLLTSNEVYTQIQDINISNLGIGSCITVMASNVTYDGDSHWINTTNWTSPSAVVSISQNFYNVTIKNLKIKGNVSTGGGCIFDGSNLSVIDNVTMWYCYRGINQLTGLLNPSYSNLEIKWHLQQGVLIQSKNTSIINASISHGGDISNTGQGISINGVPNTTIINANIVNESMLNGVCISVTNNQNYIYNFTCLNSSYALSITGQGNNLDTFFFNNITGKLTAKGAIYSSSGLLGCSFSNGLINDTANNGIWVVGAATNPSNYTNITISNTNASNNDINFSNNVYANFVNVSYNHSRIFYTQTEQIYEYNYFGAFTNYSNGSYVGNIPVTANETISNTVWMNITSNASGYAFGILQNEFLGGKCVAVSGQSGIIPCSNRTTLIQCNAWRAGGYCFWNSTIPAKCQLNDSNTFGGYPACTDDVYVTIANCKLQPYATNCTVRNSTQYLHNIYAYDDAGHSSSILGFNGSKEGNSLDNVLTFTLISQCWTFAEHILSIPNSCGAFDFGSIWTGGLG